MSQMKFQTHCKESCELNAKGMERSTDTSCIHISETDTEKDKRSFLGFRVQKQACFESDVALHVQIEAKYTLSHHLPTHSLFENKPAHLLLLLLNPFFFLSFFS